MNPKRIFAILTAILLLLIMVRTVTALVHHQQLKNNYVDQPGAYDYQAAVGQGRIDLLLSLALLSAGLWVMAEIHAKRKTSGGSLWKETIRSLKMC